MGFNSGFKGLNSQIPVRHWTFASSRSSHVLLQAANSGLKTAALR